MECISRKIIKDKQIIDVGNNSKYMKEDGR
jgi:hypothetical protein